MVRVPPHIFWPAFVVGLLMFNVGMSFTILFMAQSDDGPQIIPDYYTRSIHFEEELQARQAFTNRGWQVQVIPGSPRHTLVVVDVDEMPVVGLTGEVLLKRPHLSEAQSGGELVATELDGVYAFEGDLYEVGRWFADVHLVDGGEFVYVRHEFSLIR